MNSEKLLPLVTLAVCVVATFFFVQFIYTPIQSEILSMQVETRRLQAVENDLNEFIRRHGDLEKFSAQIESQLEESQELLPAEPAQDAFAAELYRVAEKNNVLINSVQIGEIETANEIEDKKISRQTIHLHVEADYISTVNFLREIINGSRLVSIENISIDSGENFLTGDIELSIFNLAPS